MKTYKTTYFLNGPEYGREMMLDECWYINVPIYEDLGSFNPTYAEDKTPIRVTKYRRVFCGDECQIMLDPETVVTNMQVLDTLRRIESDEDKVRLMARGLWQMILGVQRCS